MIKGKSPEEIRKTFNIQNDFTPEEEDQIRRENEWAEEYVHFPSIQQNPTNNSSQSLNIAVTTCSLRFHFSLISHHDDIPRPRMNELGFFSSTI